MNPLAFSPLHRDHGWHGEVSMNRSTLTSSIWFPTYSVRCPMCCSSATGNIASVMHLQVSSASTEYHFFTLNPVLRTAAYAKLHLALVATTVTGADFMRAVTLSAVSVLTFTFCELNMIVDVGQSITVPSWSCMSRPMSMSTPSICFLAYQRLQMYEFCFTW